MADNDRQSEPQRCQKKQPTVRPRELFVDNGPSFENVGAIRLLAHRLGIIEHPIGRIDDRLPKSPASPDRSDDQASQQQNDGRDSIE